MKKKYQYLLVFIIYTLLTYIYSFHIAKMTGDEIWNYGFAYNIYHGLIPYRDFNMILTPLYPITILPMFMLFNDSIKIFHIYNALIVGIMLTLAYKKIGIKSLMLYPIIILGYVPSYNLFSLFLYIVLLEINTTKSKRKDIYIGLIISLIFLTKQTIGIALLIPGLIESKNKKKTIISFIIPILLIMIYLMLNNALYQFIDYCFLGMLSFTDNNKTFSIYSIITISISIYFIYKMLKTRKIKYLYGVAFQIITIPIADKYHFFVGLCALVYVFLIENTISKKMVLYLILFTNITLLSILGLKYITDKEQVYHYETNDILKNRTITEGQENYLNNYNTCLNIIKQDKNKKLFVLSSNAYFLKLANYQTINKFDLINNGNMGYKGYLGYVEEIDKICKKENCIFIVENYKEEDLGQTNKQIIEYPKEKYNLKYSVGQFSIYE